MLKMKENASESGEISKATVLRLLVPWRVVNVLLRPEDKINYYDVTKQKSVQYYFASPYFSQVNLENVITLLLSFLI